MAAQEHGAVPVDAVMADTRSTMKVFLPQVFEPIENEVLCLGAEWSNSDYGNGAYSVRFVAWRLWCTNFATMEDTLCKVHRGGRLTEDVVYSAKTHQLDTATQVSATKDVIKGMFEERKVSNILDGIKLAGEKKMSWVQAKEVLAKYLGKDEITEAKGMFEDESDGMRLPPMKSPLKASNICSWFAQRQEDSERKIDLERAAGSILQKSFS
jgi:hypothetical protein